MSPGSGVGGSSLGQSSRSSRNDTEEPGATQQAETEDVGDSDDEDVNDGDESDEDPDAQHGQDLARSMEQAGALQTWILNPEEFEK